MIKEVGNLEHRTFAELISAFLGIWMIGFPTFFLKFLARGSQVNYENFKATFKRVKKEGPANLSERFAYKYGGLKMLRDISMNKAVYNPPTTEQKWLMRLLGMVLVFFSLGVLFNLIQFR